MAKLDQNMLAMKRMASAAEVVRAFSASEANRAIVAMLEELITSYKFDLIHVPVDGLIKLQTAIQQTQAIRDVVADESNNMPKV
jgi:hypothetical protein